MKSMRQKSIREHERAKELENSIRLVIAAVLVLTSTLLAALPARATDTSPQAFLNNQSYNQLVGDSDFVDIGSMSVGDIQSFLQSQGSDLATLDSSHLGSGANGRSAAQIIYDAAHAAYDAASGCANGICINGNTGTISPKAILITLQKEEGLITNWHYDSSQDGRLNAAMGYGCPDSGGCDSQYAGFSNQVGWASWQLRYNYEGSRTNNSHVAPYIIQGLLPNMTYNIPSLGLSGSVTVYLSNNATAALYRYTPHLFNGNYNFWQLGINWFGFGTNSSSGGGVNDTSALQAGTYADSFVASGTKASEVTAVFNGQTISGTGTTTWKVTLSPAVGNNSYTVYYKNSDNSSAGSKPITVVRRTIGDINGDGKVDILDMSIMFSHWNQTIQGDNFADLNNVNNWMSLNPDVDNTINILDLSLMFAHWTG